MRMINRFVYSCQKLKLAVGLARFDLLFLLDGLSSFKDVITPARFFVKPSAEPFSRRLESFLAVSRNAGLTVLLSELAALAPESSAPLFLSEKTEHFPSGPVVLRKKSDCDSFFAAVCSANWRPAILPPGPMPPPLLTSVCFWLPICVCMLPNRRR